MNVIDPSLNVIDPSLNIYKQYKCSDCKRWFSKDSIANFSTPRCWSCHNILVINITVQSCNIT